MLCQDVGVQSIRYRVEGAMVRVWFVRFRFRGVTMGFRVEGPQHLGCEGVRRDRVKRKVLGCKGMNVLASE